MGDGEQHLERRISITLEGDRHHQTRIYISFEPNLLLGTKLICVLFLLIIPCVFGCQHLLQAIVEHDQADI